MGKERSAGFLIFRRSNEQIEYLLLKASEMGMHWGPPKGHVDSGEDDIATALRETREEAGYLKEDLHIYKDPYKVHYKVGENDKTVVYFLAELINIQKQPQLSHEHTEYRWANKDDAIPLVNFVNFTKMVNYFHYKIGNLV